MADESVKISVVLLKIVAFFAFAGVIGFIFYKVFKKWTDQAEKGLRRHAIMAFVFCLLMAYVAEKFFGVADITGAFIAGLIISNTSKSDFVLKKFDTMSYMLLSPVFFASIGLKVELPKMSTAIVGFAVILTIVAILTKIVGCALGAKMCGYKNYQCARIGVGMISRGEVALIVARSTRYDGRQFPRTGYHRGSDNNDHHTNSAEDRIQERSECKYPGKRKRSDFLLRGY